MEHTAIFEISHKNGLFYRSYILQNNDSTMGSEINTLKTYVENEESIFKGKVRLVTVVRSK